MPSDTMKCFGLLYQDLTLSSHSLPHRSHFGSLTVLGTLLMPPKHLCVSWYTSAHLGFLPTVTCLKNPSLPDSQLSWYLFFYFSLWLLFLPNFIYLLIEFLSGLDKNIGQKLARQFQGKRAQNEVFIFLLTFQKAINILRPVGSLLLDRDLSYQEYLSQNIYCSALTRGKKEEGSGFLISFIPKGAEVVCKPFSESDCNCEATGYLEWGKMVSLKDNPLLEGIMRHRTLQYFFSLSSLQ